MVKGPLYFLLLFILGGLCYGQTVVDGRSFWRVGISSFDVKAEADELGYLAVSMPLLLYDKLADIQSHTYDEEEKALYREFLIALRAEQIEKDKADILRRQDALLFEKGNRESLYASLYEDTLKKDEELTKLAAMDRSTIEVAAEKPVQFLYALEARLLTPPLIPIREFMKLNSLDFYIDGYIEEVEGWIYIEIRAFAAGVKDPVFVYANAAVSDALDGKITEAAGDLRTHVLGQKWGELVVRGEVDKARTFVNGVFMGSGSGVRFTLPVGDHRLTVKAEGFVDFSVDFTLSHKERKEITAALTKAELSRLLLTSLPSGADVYQSSQWRGKTPLLLDAGDKAGQIVLSSKDFTNTQIVVEGHTGVNVPKLSFLEQPLTPSFLDRTELVKKKQDSFYLSAGFLMLSLPVPFLMYSLAMDFSAAFNDSLPYGNAGELDRLYKSISVCYDGYMVGLVLTGTLFVHTLARLVDYILSRELNT